jgi:hypothetical protein
VYKKLQMEQESSKIKGSAHSVTREDYEHPISEITLKHMASGRQNKV